MSRFYFSRSVIHSWALFPCYFFSYLESAINIVGNFPSLLILYKHLSCDLSNPRSVLSLQYCCSFAQSQDSLWIHAITPGTFFYLCSILNLSVICLDTQSTILMTFSGKCYSASLKFSSLVWVKYNTSQIWYWLRYPTYTSDDNLHIGMPSYIFNSTIAFLI